MGPAPLGLARAVTLPAGWHRWGATPEGPRYRKREGSRVLVVVVRTCAPGREGMTLVVHEHAKRWRRGGNMATVHVRAVVPSAADVDSAIALGVALELESEEPE